MKIQLIVPCYNEQEALPEFYTQVKEVIDQQGWEYELLFIDDGQQDCTIKTIKSLAEQDSSVRYIQFQRNFGKESAMYAGFCNVTGDYIAVMDADLQDPPSLLPEMVELVQSGEYDSVATRRVSRDGEPVIRSWFARQFYKIINLASDVDVVDGARDFRLMTKQMVDAIVKMGERNRFQKGIFGWIGFRTYWLPYKNTQRIAGETKWNFWSLFKYGIDGIVNFQQVPLSIVSWLGLVITACQIISLLFIVIRKLMIGDPVAGWAQTMTVILFMGGLQLFSLGIIGQYIAKIYIESKQRPHYIVRETNIIINREDADK